jgi:hypothetical protein
MAHAYLNTLFDTVFSFAKLMLSEHGEFYPFGATMSPSGEITKNAFVLVENIEGLWAVKRMDSRPISSRPRGVESSANSLAAYERTSTRFLAWAAASSFDPRSLPFPTALEAYRFLGDGKNSASLKQIRAALSFAYKALT